MGDLKFLLDENLSPTIRNELRQRNIAIDVLRIGDVGVPPLGTPDEAILEWIETSSLNLHFHLFRQQISYCSLNRIK